MNEARSNESARFLPQRDGRERPCVVVAGIAVYVYIHEGHLCVSVDYDGVDPAVVTEAGTVPTRVRLSDAEVYTAR